MLVWVIGKTQCICKDCICVVCTSTECTALSQIMVGAFISYQHFSLAQKYHFSVFIQLQKASVDTRKASGDGK